MTFRFFVEGSNLSCGVSTICFRLPLVVIRKADCDVVDLVAALIADSTVDPAAVLSMTSLMYRLALQLAFPNANCYPSFSSCVGFACYVTRLALKSSAEERLMPSNPSKMKNKGSN